MRSAGLVEAATGHVDRAVTLYQQCDDHEGMTNTMLTCALLHVDSGRLAEGLSLSAELLRQYRSLDAPDGEVSVLILRSDVLQHVGRFDDALTCARQALATGSAIGSHAGQIAAAAALATAQLAAGESAEALVTATRYLPAAVELGVTQEAELALAAGMANHALGRHDRALAHLERAINIADHLDDRNLLIDALLARATSRRALDPTIDTQPDIHRAKNTARQAGLALREGIALVFEAELALDQGDYTTAQRTARAAAEFHQNAGSLRWQTRATAVLTQCLRTITLSTGGSGAGGGRSPDPRGRDQGCR